MPTLAWIPISIAAILYWRMCFRWVIDDEFVGMDTWGEFWATVALSTVFSIFPFIPFWMISDYLNKAPRRFKPSRAARVIGGESRRAKIKRLEAKNAEAQKVIREFEAGRI